MSVPIPKNEVKRLNVLWQYEVLDTVPEEIFDDLTELAADICETPVALISLVDEDRQWFMSRVGVNVTETPRHMSFCSHAILSDSLFIVPDATKDERFKNHLLVMNEPKIRFYAGAPLITPDGHALGTICVMDKVPRTLRPQQQEALRVLAHHVVTQLELRRHARELLQARANGKEKRAELAKAEAEIEKLRGQLARLKARRPSAKRKSSKKARC